MFCRGIILALVALHAAHVRAASAPSGTFDVLSMNVAGLPEILNGNGTSLALAGGHN
jgi:hypothetical protein